MIEAHREKSLDNSLLVSAIVVATTGFQANESKLSKLIDYLAGNYVFYEILLIEPESTADDVRSLMSMIAKSAPQVRHLQIEDTTDFDAMASFGYAECIGDIIFLTSIDEIEFIDIPRVMKTLTEEEGLVRVRRRGTNVVEGLTSKAIQILTGLNVDTRFCRTMALSRNVLTGFSARPDQIALFRFTSHRFYRRQRIIMTDMPQTRSGIRLLARRVDVFTRLLATAAPRLLRISSVFCMTISLGAMMVLAYVLLVWAVKSEVTEGWSSSVLLMSLLLFAQMAASAVICLGLSKLLDRQESSPLSRAHLETSISDLFGTRAQMLNVQTSGE